MATQIQAQESTWGGARMVTNLQTLPAGSNPSGLATAGDRVLFFATADDSPTGMYVADGAETRRLSLDLPEGVSVYMDPVGSTETRALFLDQGDRELWGSDGTEHGTVRLLSTNSRLRVRCQLQNAVVIGDEAGDEWRVWMSDGTRDGTRQIVDSSNWVGPGTCLETPGGTYMIGGRKVADRTFVNELWKTDGTAEGTSFIQKLPEHMGRAKLLGRRLIFPRYADRCCKTRITILDLDSGAMEVLSAPTSISDLYRSGGGFMALESSDGGVKLWRTDGTISGTGVAAVFPGLEDIRIHGETNGVLFFSARTASSGYEPWRTDGTEDGTYQLADINPGPASPDLEVLAVVDGRLYAHGYDPAIGVELWVSDGTVSGTFAIDIYPGAESSWPCYAATAHGGIYVSALTPGTGRELVFADPTTRRSRVVTDLVHGRDTGSRPRPISALGGDLFFSARSDAGSKYWRSDGTPEGTVPVSFGAPTNSSKFVPHRNGRLYGSFRSQDYRNHEVWRLDGTPRKLLTVNDNWPTIGSVGDDILVAADNRIQALGADDVWRTLRTVSRRGIYGRVVSGDRVSFLLMDERVGWIATNGTSEYTWILPHTANPDQTGQGIVHNDALVLSQERDGKKGLWRIDPNSGAPAQLLLDTSESRYLADDFRRFGSLIYFELENQPWITDGTPSGTRPIFEVMPPDGAWVNRSMVVDDRLYLTLGRRSLWVVTGPGAAPELALAAYSKHIDLIGSADGQLLVAADDEEHGRELWAVSGNQARLVADLAAGPASSDPKYAFQVGDKLFLSAESSSRGRELWVLNRFVPEVAPADFHVATPFPNPAGDQFRIAVRGATDAVQADVYDMLGRRVRTALAPLGDSEMAIATSDLAAGVYLVRVESGGASETRRVVVTR